MPPSAPSAFLYALLLHGVLGIIDTVMNLTLAEWHVGETMLIRVDHGWASWMLGAMAAASLAWAVRDGLAALRLARKAA